MAGAKTLVDIALALAGWPRVVKSERESDCVNSSQVVVLFQITPHFTSSGTWSSQSYTCSQSGSFRGFSEWNKKPSIAIWTLNTPVYCVDYHLLISNGGCRPLGYFKIGNHIELFGHWANPNLEMSRLYFRTPWIWYLILEIFTLAELSCIMRHW